MKKIAFVINSPEYVRNYIESGVLSQLVKLNRVYFVVKKGVSLPEKMFDNVYFYKEDNQLSKKKKIIFNILMYKFRKKSSSFNYRIERNAVFQLNEWINITSIKDILKVILRMARRLKTNSISFLASCLPVSIILKLFDGNSFNEDLEKTLDNIEPELVITPSSAYSPEDIDIAIICRKKTIISFLLIDNWDNLSSKSILWTKPDYVGVWGDQSKRHAIEIQGFSEKQVFLIGSARFSKYFEKRENNLKDHFQMPYILFVGTALAFNEIKVIKILERELENNRDIYKDLKIIYRPHPWRQGSDFFESENFRHVLLDPQLSDSYLNHKHNEFVQPSLSYYPSLLSNARFIIGGMTSMIIEAQIFYKKYIGLIYEEKFSVTSPRKVFENYIHFRGLETVNSIFFCNDLSDLPCIFRSLFDDSEEIDKILIDDKRRFFLYDDDDIFGDRLVKIVDKICMQNSG